MGHLIWFVSALLIATSIELPVSGILEKIIVDIIPISIGLVWLMTRPGLAPVIFLGLIQMIFTIITSFTFYETAFSPTQNKMLFINIIFRISGITMLVSGYLKYKKINKTNDL